ncbi:sugar nucleotide-binding protein, partial [Escherichia coli]|uniref:sugar nucleotide-binding protein n=1 Tax=Escherichia coli TaxID=562 RepID=UPI003C70AB07
IIHSLSAGRRYAAACDVAVSPTFVPDLVHATLDLLLDGVTGVMHLANDGQATWADFAREVATVVGLDAGLIDERPAASLGWRASRPANSALASERAWIMPTLEDALGRLSADLRLNNEKVGYLC